MQYESKCWEFEAPLAQADIKLQGRPREKLAQLGAAVAARAADIFKPCSGPPRKHWITDQTWGLIKDAWHLKDLLRDARRSLRQTRLQAVHAAWVGELHGKYGDEPNEESAEEMSATLRKARMQEAVIHHRLAVAQAKKAASLRKDREDQWTQIAEAADLAAEAGTMRETYRLIKRLGAFKTTPLPGIMLESGELAGSQEEEESRWEEFFATLLIGDLHDDLPQPDPPPPPSPEELREVKLLLGPLLDKARHVVKKLASNKSVGPDKIPAELIRAGVKPYCSSWLK